MADEERLLDHEYDGIREYDNPTPGWWHAIFFGVFLFSVFYLMVTIGNEKHTPEHEHRTASLAWTRQMFGTLGDLEVNEENLVRYYADESEAYAGRWMPFAESLFMGKCASCHRADGSGDVGPNLTDDAFIHIDTVTDIADVIRDGAKGGAMPAWGNQLHPNEIVLLSSYVASLRAQQLPGKGPEGDIIEPWPTLDEIGPAESTGTDEGG